MGHKERSPALLTIEGLGKSYDGRKVLKNVKLELRQGESVALLGSNGCGKSTLLKCCNRLVKPDTGSVLLEGQDLCQMDDKELRSARTRLGFVFQKHNLVPRLSSLSNVIHGYLGVNSSFRYWLQALTPEPIRQKALDCLIAVGLGHLSGQRASNLSGGESQRVAIARALMQDPALLLADEPVASLDPRVGHEIMALFVKLVAEKGVSLLFVSHDLDHALEYADRIVAMKHGEVIVDKRRDEVKKSELKKIYD